MRINANNIKTIVLQDGELEEVEEFTYLGSVMDRSGSTNKDIKIRTGKARTAFNVLKILWNAGEISKCSLRRKIQSFISRCLTQIQRVYWPNWISNEDLWKDTEQLPSPVQIRKRTWTWIGQTLRKDPRSITRQSLQWNPQGKRARGRPRNSWRRSTTEEMTKAGYTWHDLARNAQNRVRWRIIVSGLCSSKE